VLYKSCRHLQQKSIVPTHLPYVVSLVRFYETDSAIYLQLQHAAGGRLWSYVGAYLNQCADVTAYCNIEPPRPTGVVHEVRRDHQKSERVGSDTDLGQFPTPADSAAAACTAGVEWSESSDVKSKLSSSDVDSTDEYPEPIDRNVSTTSSPECVSREFGEILHSTNSALKYFRIDSRDSSEHASRQVSCSSTEDSFCRVHLTPMSSGVCPFCSKAEPRQPATTSAGGSNSPNEMSIYDVSHGETVDKSEQSDETTERTCCSGDISTDAGSAGDGQIADFEVELSRHSSVKRNMRELSFDSCDRRRRRRTLSSAFGELDLAESTATCNSASLKPLVHLPESCIQQWAAEMVVAISRLHAIGIICRQVDSSCLEFILYVNIRLID